MNLFYDSDIWENNEDLFDVEKLLEICVNIWYLTVSL